MASHGEPVNVMDDPAVMVQMPSPETETASSQAATQQPWGTPEVVSAPAQSSLEATQSISQSTFPSAAFDVVPLSLPVLGSLVTAVLLVLVLFVARKRKSSTKGSAILLTGPSDAGKTAIHSALAFHQVLPSHTSLQTNTSMITLPSPEKQQTQTVRLIDVPGHPRIRDQFKAYLSDAKALVFVVDSSTVARNGAAVAEHLHHILHALTSIPPSHSPPSLLILAHKSDLLATSSSNAALAVSRVRTILERELEKRRASQKGGVGVGQLGEEEGTDAELGGLECAGPAGSGFRFKDWEGGEIEVLGSSVKALGGGAGAEKGLDGENAEDGLEHFRQWLQELQ